MLKTPPPDIGLCSIIYHFTCIPSALVGGNRQAFMRRRCVRDGEGHEDVAGGGDALPTSRPYLGDESVILKSVGSKKHASNEAPTLGLLGELGRRVDDARHGDEEAFSRLRAGRGAGGLTPGLALSSEPPARG